MTAVGKEIIVNVSRSFSSNFMSTNLLILSCYQLIVMLNGSILICFKTDTGLKRLNFFIKILLKTLIPFSRSPTFSGFDTILLLYPEVEISTGLLFPMYRLNDSFDLSHKYSHSITLPLLT